jgi:hypothetical protein
MVLPDHVEPEFDGHAPLPVMLYHLGDDCSSGHSRNAVATAMTLMPIACTACLGA